MQTKPNILLVMADQLTCMALPPYGNPIVKAPHISRLAQGGVVFDSAYCNFPICAPSRFSMLSGKLPHSIAAYDNASEFPASTPTVAHYLGSLGYHTILCGKMHFVGPDQLHGYHERLTTDIYPADFVWTPDWLKGPRYRMTGVSMRPVLEAGPCVRSMQIDYDDEAEYHGLQKLYDLARAPDRKPFFMTLSYTHPHHPFVCGQEHWDLYRHEDIDLPRVAPIPFGELDPRSQWLYYGHAHDLYEVAERDVLAARHAYYGMVSYVDDKIGRLMKTLEETGFAENTLVIFIADHGEMLGERGMWFKQTFYESSVRVPMILSMPGRLAPARIGAHVSLLDLLPTLLEFAASDEALEPVRPLDGKSLMPLIEGVEAGCERSVISEYSAEGVCAATRMLRSGPWKYLYTHGLAPMLYNLDDDPDELHDLAGTAQLADIEKDLRARALEGWDPEQMHATILQSQKERLFLNTVAQSVEGQPNWAYQPFVDESRRYIRGGGSAGPTSAKARARFPYVEPVQPNRKQ